jgi:hypothetical protein
MTEKKQSVTFSKLFGRAATDTVNMIVVGAGVIALSAQYWLVGALGLAAYGTLVALDVVNPENKKKLAQSPQLPDPASLRSDASRSIVKGILKAKVELSSVLAETPDGVKSHLSTILFTTEELETRAIGLLQRAEDLTGYLKTTNDASIQQEISSLTQKARDARDETARAEYNRARAEREEQIKTVSDIEGAKDRVLAQLSRIQATLEGLPPKIVRMRVLDAQAADALTGEVSAQLDQMNDEARAFEETLSNLAQV